MLENRPDWASIQTTTEASEAELLRGMLESEGIISKVEARSISGIAVAAYTGSMNKVYDVCVNATDAEIARALIEALNNGRGRISDSELEAAALEMYDERV